MNRIKEAARPRLRSRANEVMFPRCGDFSGSRLGTQPVLQFPDGVGILASDLSLMGACWRASLGEKGVLERQCGMSNDRGDLALVAMADKPRRRAQNEMFDPTWQSCLDAVTDRDLEDLSRWRGFSRQDCYGSSPKD